MEFNIIKREPVWLQERKDYTFIYQIQGEPKKYKIDMVYLSVGGNKPQFYFLDNKTCRENKHFSSGNEDVDTENRNKFREEIEKWQKGGAYRKSHPIVTTRMEDLREQKQKLENQLKDTEREIEKERLYELSKIIDNYQSDLDEDSINKFKDDFKWLLNGRYCIKMIWLKDDGYTPVLFDNKCNKYRGLIKFFDDEIEIKDLPEKVLKYLL